MWSKIDSEGSFWLTLSLIFGAFVGLLIVCITSYNINNDQAILETNKLKIEACVKIESSQQLACINNIDTTDLTRTRGR